MSAIQVSGPRQAEDLATAVQSFVRSVDGGASNVRIHVLGPGTIQRTAIGVLRQALEIDLLGKGGDRGNIEQVGRELSIHPAVLVVNATTWSDAEARSTIEALRAIGSSVNKVFQGAALTAIVIHRGVLGTAGSEIAFDVGSPHFSIVEALGSPESVLWSAYAHHRLAWETGGNFDRALSWSDALVAQGIQTGQDDQLESFLNTQSAAILSVLPRSDVEATRAFLRMSSADPARARLRRELEQHRILWCPSAVPRIVPWMARALLLAEATPLLRAQLRWCLVCAPLRRDLLACCLDIEGHARAHHARDLGEIPDGAQTEWESYRQSGGSSDSRFYPASSPATPDGPFAFVELGGFLASVRVAASRSRLLHKLRMLRNYLAHGHYVSWACIRDIIEVERGIDL